MNKQDKQLLLQDLCARLPYGIVINTGDKDLKLDRQHQGIGVLYPEDCSDAFNKRNNNASFYITISGCYYGEEIKPYLRSLSSMTDEERIECISIGTTEDTKIYRDYWDKRQEGVNILPIPHFAMDWCNAHHFDYRGLIPKGLALEAPKDMYK